MTDADSTESRQTPSAEELAAAVEAALESWDVSLTDAVVGLGQNGGFEVAAQIEGELLLEDVLAQQGPLLYAKEGVEVTLSGFRDDSLVLEVGEFSD